MAAFYTAKKDDMVLPIQGDQIKDVMALGYKVYKTVEIEVTDPDTEVQEWEEEQKPLDQPQIIFAKNEEYGVPNA